MDIDRIHIYRIFHIDNLRYILQTGKLTNKNHPEANPNYISIGDLDLIESRSGGSITTVNSNQIYYPSKDFIPFYFAPRSVMLLRIKTGYNVQKVSQSKILTVIYKLSDIVDDIEYLYTDGHGFKKVSQWFDDLAYLDELSWDVIHAREWNNTENDPDRMRRKQAEFWIKNELSVEKMLGIAVCNEQSKAKVERILNSTGSSIPVKVKKNYYY